MFLYFLADDCLAIHETLGALLATRVNFELPLLRKSSLQARVVVSRNRCVDVLPVRASKGHALRYISWRFGIDMSHVLTAGDSGNDIDMLRGLSRGIVVGNYSKEMDVLKKSKDVYFSSQASAAGILDGLRHYGV